MRERRGDVGGRNGLAADDARREFLELSITAAGIGTFEWDLVENTLGWDDRLVELFGYDPANFDQTFDSFSQRLHSEDRDRVTKELQAAIDACGEFQSEYRIVIPGGHLRWIAARGRALCDEKGRPVRMLGAAWDFTERAENEARAIRGLESMATAFFSLDPSWRFTYANSEAERVLGQPRRELIGKVVWDVFPAAVGSVFEENYRRAMETGEPVAFDAYYPAPLDAWFEVRAWRNADGLAVYFLDVTSRHKAHLFAEQTAKRAHLLSRITDELVGTLDSTEAARRLSTLVVPTLADWSIVTLIDDDRQAGTRHGLRHAVAHHRDPAMQETAEKYARARLDAFADDAIIVQAMQTGEPQFLDVGATTRVSAMIAPGPVRDLITALAPESVVVLPLTGRNGPVGMLTLVNGADRGRFSSEDLVTASHVAGRAGLVLDNARLYRQQRELAEGLQRSLLTPPVQPDHVQIVVRYSPASEAAQVGGDWYDAFFQPGGSTVFVIGDVIGHDTEAASAMGQIRSVVRTLGAVGDDGPAKILENVDRVMETLRTNTTATAVAARLEQSNAHVNEGVTRLRWSNAGHPPPMVITPGGTVVTLNSTTPDPLLGVAPGEGRQESELVLERDVTVLLYTDGLVERRGQSLDVGLELLQACLHDLADEGLDHMCDELLSRMVPEEHDDDVALLAMRLHPQDEPRPPEAGPNTVPSNVPDDPS